MEIELTKQITVYILILVRYTRIPLPRMLVSQLTSTRIRDPCNLKCLRLCTRVNASATRTSWPETRNAVQRTERVASVFAVFGKARDIHK